MAKQSLFKKLSIIAGAIIGIAIMVFLTFAAAPWVQNKMVTVDVNYDPPINPADFVAGVDNKYFTLKPGRRFKYRNAAAGETIEVFVTRETKKIMGVNAVVVRATERKNEVMKEDTYDWYAQDKQGNVWYFGETVDNYENGKISNHSGSWMAGEDGAKPGIVMLANPKVGDSYRQEYYRGKAEDMGTVVAINKKVTTPAGTFDDCLQIRDWNRLEAASEYKYFCPKIGFLAAEESTLPLFGKKVQLISITDEK